MTNDDGHDALRRELLAQALLLAIASALPVAALAQAPEDVEEAGEPASNALAGPAQNPMFFEVAAPAGFDISLPAEDAPAEAAFEQADAAGGGAGGSDPAWTVKFALNPIDSVKMTDIGSALVTLELPSRPTIQDGPADPAGLALKVSQKLWEQRWPALTGNLAATVKTNVALKYGGAVAGDVKALLAFNPAAWMSVDVSFKMEVKVKPGVGVEAKIHGILLNFEFRFP